MSGRKPKKDICDRIDNAKAAILEMIALNMEMQARVTAQEAENLKKNEIKSKIIDIYS
jgi:hypothetical protein